MHIFRLALAAALIAPLGACVLPYHEENAALVAPRPPPPPAALAAYAAPNAEYPTVGGDTLKGVSSYPATPAR